jgi:hypothetical protein
VLDASASRRYFGFGSFPLAYVAPRANHLDRLAILVSDELLLIVDPAIASVFLEKPIFHRVRAPLEQANGFSLYRAEIIRVYAAAPKIRIFQVLVGFVAQALLNILADECRREIARRLVAINYGRRRRQQTPDSILRKDQGFADLFARCNVVPRAYHLDRIARRIAQQLQFVTDPAIAPILFLKAIFNAEAPLRK